MKNELICSRTKVEEKKKAHKQWMSEQRAQSTQSKFSLASHVYQMSFSASVQAKVNGDQ